MTQKYESWQKDYPNLGKTTWTWEQVFELNCNVKRHERQCGECQAAYDALPDPESPEYDDLDWDTFTRCPVAESLSQEYGDASLEWSWQPDFPKREDPRWDEWSKIENKWDADLWS